jgi:hypothetical protein
MKILDIGEVIATRILKISSNNEPPKDIIVRLGKPRPYLENGDYICPYDVQVAGIREPRTRCAFGVDGFQAIQLALLAISSDVHGHMYTDSTGQVRSGEVWWFEKGDDLGFPVPTVEEGEDPENPPFPRLPA